MYVKLVPCRCWVNFSKLQDWFGIRNMALEDKKSNFKIYRLLNL